MNPFQLPQDAAASAARPALEERPPGADQESSPNFAASFSDANHGRSLPALQSFLRRPAGLPASQVGQIVYTHRGSNTPVSAAFSRQVATRAVGQDAIDVPPPTGPPVTYEPGGCLETTRLDAPPPANATGQGNFSAGVSPAVGSSNLRFGTLEPSPHLDAAPGWTQGWPASQYQSHDQGVVGGAPRAPFTAGNATAVGSPGPFRSLNPHEMTELISQGVSQGHPQGDANSHAEARMRTDA